MQLSYAAIVSILAAVAHAQTIASEVAMLPSCSLSCLETAISGAGCSLTDYACQCGSAKDAITKAATPCIAGACSTSDTLNVEKVTTEICSLVAAEPAASSSSSSAASSAASSASSVASSVASSATSASSTSSASAASSTASSAASSKAASTATTSSAAKTTATSSSPATVSTAAAAGRLQAAGAVAGAAVLAAFAL